ncbi:MAG: ABC-2 transporter permease [Anaerovoracaceae bacterium]
MKGLLLKDLLVITKQLKIFLIVIPIMAIIGLGSISSLAILLGAALPMTAIAYDERCKWNELAIMMPYSKHNLVIHKYVLGYIGMFGAAIIVVLGQWIISVMGRELSNINMLPVAIAGGLIFLAIELPILFRFGTEKGRYIFIIAIAVVCASGPILKEVEPNLLSTFSKIAPLLIIGIACLMNIISIVISIRIKSKAE